MESMSDTPLHKASGHDGNKRVKPSLETARQLLESDQGRKYLKVRDGYWRTPLHVAAFNDESGKIVELLIQHGANIKARDNDDSTPLIIASYSNNPSATLVLLRHGANIKAQDKYGWTALHFAFHNGNEEVAEMILKSVVDSAIASSSSLSLGLGKGLEEARNLVMNIRNNYGRTVLEEAEFWSWTNIIQWWETLEREKEEQQEQQRLFENLLERTDPAMNALWPHMLHKTGKKSISHLWYFVQMKGPSLIVESNKSRPAERGQASNLKRCRFDAQHEWTKSLTP